MSETLVVWLLPLAEAVTVICEVPSGVPFTGGVELLELPPHATTPVNTAKMQSRTNTATALCVCCFRFRASITSTSKLRNANGSAGLGDVGEPRKVPKTEPDPVVLMVSVVVADAPFGVICAGLKLQLASIGNPEHENETALFRLGAVANVIVNVADPPADTVLLPGEADTAKGAVLVPTSWLTMEDVLEPKFESPPYAAVIESAPVASDDVMNVATPDAFRGCAASEFPLTLKVTTPVGTPVAGATAVTVAVRVTDCPGADGSGDEVKLTEVIAADASPTFCWSWDGSAIEVLELKFVSPW